MQSRRGGVRPLPAGTGDTGQRRGGTVTAPGADFLPAHFTVAQEPSSAGDPQVLPWPPSSTSSAPWVGTGAGAPLPIPKAWVGVLESCLSLHSEPGPRRAEAWGGGREATGRPGASRGPAAARRASHRNEGPGTEQRRAGAARDDLPLPASARGQGGQGGQGAEFPGVPRDATTWGKATLALPWQPVDPATWG